MGNYKRKSNCHMEAIKKNQYLQVDNVENVAIRIEMLRSRSQNSKNNLIRLLNNVQDEQNSAQLAVLQANFIKRASSCNSDQDREETMMQMRRARRQALKDLD